MIPSDIATGLRFVTKDLPAPPQPTPAIQQVTDALSEFSVGQRIMAEIQTLLPNGTYRAMVAQREVTLALPFSAKPGDSLELEVTESAGKLSLAVFANRGQTPHQDGASASASTSLSNTGKLIGDLLGEIGQEGKQARPAPLNGNQALVEAFPKSAADLAPILKEALSKSGVFYESHQARWAQGKLSIEALLQEPQGKLSTLSTEQAHLSGSTGSNSLPNNLIGAEKQAGGNAPFQQTISGANFPNENHGTQSSQNSVIPQQLTTLVQQQLYALATETYVWQGQVWPGQNMDWEIVEEDRKRAAPDGNPGGWQTRLRLDLPTLGGLEASLHLSNGGKIEVDLATVRPESHDRLTAAREALRTQLEATGLSLSAFVVHQATSDE